VSCFRGGAILYIVRSLYMERLSYIDEHSVRVDAALEQVWPALVSALRTDFGVVGTAGLASLLGLVPAEWRGDWRGALRVGDSLPGFAVTEHEPPGRLVLEGRHRFSRYALVLLLEETSGHTTVRAQTWAEFPGVSGRAYRALVIGTGGHRVAVWRLLRTVARRVRRG
jgi:hypothetical protein